MIDLILEMTIQINEVEKYLKNRDKAVEIVLTTHAISAIRGVPSKIILNLMRIESGYRLGAINKRTGDAGILQVNVKVHNVDKQRLLTDLVYSVDEGVKILRWFKSKYKKHYVARYNCGVKKSCIHYPATRRYVIAANL